MPRPLPLAIWRMYRRCGFRSYIFTLLVVYLLAMFAFQAQLEVGNQQAARDVDEQDDYRAALRWQGGADAFERRPSASPAHIGLRSNVEVDMQFEFDNLRRVVKQGSNDHRSEIVKQWIADGNSVAVSSSQDVNNWNSKYRPASHDANIPPSCPSSPFDNLTLSEVGHDVFVYSAYWDVRPNDFDNRFNGTIVRLMAVVRGQGRPRLACRWTALDGLGVIFNDVWYYEMCENHQRPYGSFILSCAVPSHITDIPCHVTVAADQQTTVQVPVRTLNPRSDYDESSMNKFTVCVPPLFGAVSPSKLVEFFELTFLLGADRIVIYDFNVHDSIRRLLSHYSTVRCRPDADNKQPCRVDVIPWQLTTSVDTGIWYHGQSIAIQDCLYRHMAVSEYVLFSDIDEFVVPHGDNMFVWNDIVDRLWQPEQCAFQFISAFYDPNNDSPDDDWDDNVMNGSRKTRLLTMTSLQRSYEFSMIRTKCLVKPYQIFEAGIHHISKPIWAHLKVNRADRNEAYLHHYRTCSGNMGMNCRGSVEDNTMLRYQSALEKYVEESVTRLNHR